MFLYFISIILIMCVLFNDILFTESFGMSQCTKHYLRLNTMQNGSCCVFQQQSASFRRRSSDNVPMAIRKCPMIKIIFLISIVNIPESSCTFQISTSIKMSAVVEIEFNERPRITNDLCYPP